MNISQDNQPSVPTTSPLSALETAKRMVDVLSDKKAQDIVLLDVHEISGLTDYFVICSASVDRQIRAIADAVEEDLDALHTPPYKREGTPTDGWVLLDYSDVILHIFTPDQRAYYRLEQIWEQAQTIVRLQ